MVALYRVHGLVLAGESTQTLAAVLGWALHSTTRRVRGRTTNYLVFFCPVPERPLQPAVLQDCCSLQAHTVSKHSTRDTPRPLDPPACVSVQTQDKAQDVTNMCAAKVSAAIYSGPVSHRRATMWARLPPMDDEKTMQFLREGKLLLAARSWWSSS